MLRFRLGRIPVHVHFSHLLIAALFGYSFVLPGGGDTYRWPNRYLTDALAPSYNQVLILAVLIAMSVIFLSILIHELGHALVSLAFGYSPSIQLAGMGGLTQPNAPGPIPWHRDVLLTLAGPAFGAGLGGLAFLLWQQVQGRSGPLDFALTVLWEANAYWAVLNLLPVLPLDGGRISSAILTRAFGRRGFLAAQILALVVSVLVVAWGYQRQQFLAVMFGMFGIRSISAISAYFRGEDSSGRTADLGEVPLRKAAELYQAGKLEEARRLARSVLDGDVSPMVRARVHHQLGWIALKQGEGRAALDEFSQVQRIPVERHALAAAFSLVGDESRALSLWELAYREQPNATLLHEWGGALIRAGRESEARRLSGIDMAAAFSCAERVLFIRGDFRQAVTVGKAALAEKPSADRAYDTACAAARAGDKDEALKLLEHARALGFKDPEYAATDSDLESLHSDPRFTALLAALRSASP